MPFNPFFYWDSPLPMELIQKLMYEAQEQGKTIAQLVKDVDTLNKFLKDFDEAAREEIIRVLNQMAENGDFDNTIADYIDQKIKTNDNDYIDLRREFRMNYNIGDNYRYTPDGSVDTALIPKPSHMQGATFLNYNGADYYVYCLDIGGIRSHGDYNAGVIVAYNAANGNLAGQIWVNMEHMNSIDYNTKDGYIYVASCFAMAQNSAETPTAYIYRFAITDLIGRNLDISNFIDLKAGSGVGAYQPTVYTRDLKLATNGDELIQYTNCISYNDDLPANQVYCMYGHDGVSTCAIFDFEANEIIDNTLWSYELAQEWRAYKNIYGWTDSEGKILGDYMYFQVFNPSMLILINLRTQRIERFYNYPQVFDGGRWAYGEPEAIKPLPNGDFYVFCTQDIYTGNRSQFRMSQIFKGNLNTNIVKHSRGVKRFMSTVYVDGTNMNTNPDGSSANPFRTLFEACNYVNENTIENGCAISLRTHSVYLAVITTPKRVTINTDTANFKQTLTNGSAEIGGVLCTGAQQLILKDLFIRCSVPDVAIVAGANRLLNSYVSIYGTAHAALDYVRIYDNTAGVLKTAYRFEYATIDLIGWSNRFSVEITRESGGETQGVKWGGNDDTYTFIAGRCFTANCRGWATTTENIIN